MSQRPTVVLLVDEEHELDATLLADVDSVRADVGDVPAVWGPDDVFQPRPLDPPEPSRRRLGSCAADR